MKTLMGRVMDNRILFFIGLTTGRSSIMSVFPAWAEYLGLGNCRIAGADLPPHADPAAYREVVRGIEVPTGGPEFGALCTIAAQFRK